MNLTVPRAIAPYQPISSLILHSFGDASAKGVTAAVYTVVHKDQGVTQQLVCAKSRLAKKNLTIPRLELVTGHMAMNLIANIQAALNFLPHEMHCCLDSTIALYWITGQGEFRQFVSNRVHKIQQHNQARWHHVPTADNPANLGSRGGNAVDSHLCKNGPTWLSDPSNWPPHIVLEPATETMAEAKVNQEVFSIAIPKQDALDHMLSNHALPRFCELEHGYGSLFTTAEIRQETERRVQSILKKYSIKKYGGSNRLKTHLTSNPTSQANKLQLNLQ